MVFSYLTCKIPKQQNLMFLIAYTTIEAKQIFSFLLDVYDFLTLLLKISDTFLHIRYFSAISALYLNHNLIHFDKRYLGDVLKMCVSVTIIIKFWWIQQFFELQSCINLKTASYIVILWLLTSSGTLIIFKFFVHR